MALFNRRKNKEKVRAIDNFITKHFGPPRLLYLIPMQVGVFLMNADSFFPNWEAYNNVHWFTGMALFSISTYLLDPRMGRIAVPAFIILLIVFGILPERLFGA